MSQASVASPCRPGDRAGATGRANELHRVQFTQGTHAGAWGNARRPRRIISGKKKHARCRCKQGAPGQPAATVQAMVRQRTQARMLWYAAVWAGRDGPKCRARSTCCGRATKQARRQASKQMHARLGRLLHTPCTYAHMHRCDVSSSWRARHALNAPHSRKMLVDDHSAARVA